MITFTASAIAHTNIGLHTLRLLLFSKRSTEGGSVDVLLREHIASESLPTDILPLADELFT
jgi:hypothetical protein